jgi:protein-disulfide isomerase
MSISVSRRALLSAAGMGAIALALSACNDKPAAEAAKDAVKPAGETTAAIKAPETPASDAAAKPAAAVAAKEPDAKVDVAKLMTPGTLKDIALGKDDAPVTVIEYASMTCPHCARFHEATLPEITKKYVDTGKVRMILREFPFDPRAAAAFMLARCSPEDKYYPMVSVLFQQQQTWAAAEDAQAALLQISKLAGFSEESFKACLTNQKLLDDVNAVRERASKEFGVESTPTFFINGNKYSGALTVEEMSAIIDSML